MLELIVATLVISVLLLMSAQMLDRARLLTMMTGKELVRSTPQQALALLRRDVRMARAAGPAASTAGVRPLALTHPDSTTVIYSLEDGGLVRVVLASDGTELGRRTLLGEIGRWEWRSSAGLVDLTIERRREPRPEVARRVAFRPPADDIVELRLALRSDLRSGW